MARNKRHPYSLIGVDGNIFAVMGYVDKAMRQCGYSKLARDAYRENVMQSGSYDEALGMSITMIDNCNILSGYDEMTQLEKGHNRLQYVEQGHGGVQNPIEKLINEGLSNFNFEDEEPQSDEHYESDNYQILYNEMTKGLVFVLNELLGSGKEIKITKGSFKRILLSIIDSDEFWESLDSEVPNKLDEAFTVEGMLRSSVKSKLRRILNNLLYDNIAFSKYDVYHAAMQLSTSYKFYNKINKYMPDGF